MILDEVLHKDLMDYVDKRETPNEDGKVNLKEYLIAGVFRKLLEGEYKVTDMCTTDSKVFLEFSLNDEK